MKVLHSIQDLRDCNRHYQGANRVLVPTMGALHTGHTSLLDQARILAGKEGYSMASIFVNPTQFGPEEDFDAYPRQLQDDLEKCRAHGVDLVFSPNVAEMYRPNASVSLVETALSNTLCGASRPGHFDGVCTVVCKLFHLLAPDIAIFGEKDFQQLAILRQMVADLDFPIEVVAGPTVRESDGLALSSRNAYLSSEERAQAPIIHKTLLETAEAISSGTVRNFEEAERIIREKIESKSLAQIDYVSLVDRTSLKALTGSIEAANTSHIRIVAAVYFGRTRLIDNIAVDPAD